MRVGIAMILGVCEIIELEEYVIKVSIGQFIRFNPFLDDLFQYHELFRQIKFKSVLNCIGIGINKVFLSIQ